MATLSETLLTTFVVAGFIPAYGQGQSLTLQVVCHFEPFADCHSEGAERPKNLAQDRLREESL